MTDFSRQAIRQSGYLRAGFADQYDAFRPAPPPVLLDALARYAGCSAPALVVDLGSGTGLSTRAWAERATEVVGIEPNPEMRKAAERRIGQENVRYVDGFASETGLEPASADLVTCSQSFHWMERGPVLTEAARILREGGVFAAYDYDFPALIHPEVDAAFTAHLELRGRYRDEHTEVRPPGGHSRERPLPPYARVRRTRRNRSGGRGDRRVRAEPRPRGGI